jgi:hypothetical protein
LLLSCKQFKILSNTHFQDISSSNFELLKPNSFEEKTHIYLFSSTHFIWPTNITMIQLNHFPLLNQKSSELLSSTAINKILAQSQYNPPRQHPHQLHTTANEFKLINSTKYNHLDTYYLDSSMQVTRPTPPNHQKKKPIKLNLR